MFAEFHFFRFERSDLLAGRAVSFTALAPSAS